MRGPLPLLERHIQFLGHHLRDPPFLVDEIVRRDFGLLAGQPIERGI